MKAGYARVSTKEQTVDLQVDALKKAGCTAVYTEIMSGTRAERPILGKLLENLRTGDVLVVWKLDRLGRSLKHLIEVVNELMTRKIGLKSLNDPIDTTTPQGRLTFNLFASLAEFERDVIRERTQAGLSAARARGRKGASQKGCQATPNRRLARPRHFIEKASSAAEKSPANFGSQKVLCIPTYATAACLSAFIGR
jgi:DNA invertase Pin-like site-specific DNA recombinase